MQQDPTANDFDMNRHKEQLADVMNEMDEVAGIRKKGAKVGKKTPILMIIAGCLLVIGFLVYLSVN